MKSTADWLLRKSSNQLPLLELQERMLEEWRSVLSERPGKLSKLWFATDTFRASYKIGLSYRTPHVSPIKGFSLRTYDILASIIFLFVTGPYFICVAMAIRIDDKGPILYKAKYIGRDGQIIYLYEFRSLSVEKSVDGRNFDTSYTRVGRFLVKTQLIKLPLIINLIRGDVSLVGPRPVHEETHLKRVEELNNYVDRLAVRPGITGLAQLNCSWGSSVTEELKYDLRYIKHCSLPLNLQIILRTILRTLRGKS